VLENKGTRLATTSKAAAANAEGRFSLSVSVMLVSPFIEFLF
jgi:hypothetical protein